MLLVITDKGWYEYTKIKAAVQHVDNVWTVFKESVQLSVTAPVWILAFRITDYYFFGSMTKKRSDVIW